MPNRKKKPSERKSENISFRITAKRKKQLEAIARVENKNMSELFEQLIEIYTGPLDKRNEAVWKLVEQCCRILEERERQERKYKNEEKKE